MHRLFGVTMIDQGVSKLVSVDLRTAENLTDKQLIPDIKI
jgi:chromosome segregation ATPase